MPTDTPAEGSTTTALTTQQRARPMVESVQPLFDTAKFEHFQRAATALMHSSLLPPSIRGESPQQCFSNLVLVFEQADRWNMPATSLAQCISVVFGKLMYEGKVITAMLEGTLGTRLHYHWTGERGTPGYRVYVSDRDFGDLTDEQLAALAPDKYPKGWRCIDGCVGDWQTFQKDGRTVNPAWTGAASRNQLAYRGSREWARLYEPGKMLGVYGDDEITAWEDRRDVPGVAAVDSAPAISTGFSRPAADQVTDAEFTEGGDKGSPLAAETGATSAGPTESEQASSAPAKPQDDGKAAKPPRKPAAPKVAEEAKPQMDAATTAAGLSEAAGGPVATETEIERTRDQQAADGEFTAAQDPADQADTGDLSGLALDAFEAGHEAGLAGKGAGVPREWDNFADEYLQGVHSGAAERLQDAADDGTEDDDEFAGDQVGDQAVVSPFDAFVGGVRNLATWGDVKTGLNALSRTEEWKTESATAGAFGVKQARVAAGCRLAELQAKGGEPLDVQATDLTAFRCWMETVDDPDMVQAKWQELTQSPAFQALSQEQRHKMENAVKARMQELVQPKLDPSI
jgi:hypothetical protein